MMGITRALLIDPDDEARGAIRRALAATGRVEVSEEVASYEGASDKVATPGLELVVIDLDSDRDAAFRLLRQTHAVAPGAIVLPVSASHDSSLVLGAMRAGAREFLMLPAAAGELAEILDRLLTPKDGSPSQARRGPGVIAVAGAVGGVGCTTVAVNLAVSLAKNPDNSVLLCDFDLLFGSADVSLDLIPDFTLLDATQKIDRVDEALLRRAVARHPSGVQILPRPPEFEDAARVDAEALRRLLQIAKGTFSSVIVDTSKSLHSSDFAAFEMADVILLVIQLDLIGLRNAARLLKLLRSFDALAPRLKLVANRVGSFEAEISLKKAETTLGAPIDWQLPNGKKLVHESRNKGVPLAQDGTGTKVHQAILEMSHALRPFAAPIKEEKARRGFFAALF